MLGKPGRWLFIEKLTITTATITTTRSVLEGTVGTTREGRQRTKERNLIHQSSPVHSWSTFSRQENTGKKVWRCGEK